MTNVSEVSRKPSFTKVTIAKLTPSYGKKDDSKKDAYITITSIW